MSDRIELTGIRVMGVVGLLPEERERAQPVEIDLVIEADLHQAGRSDELTHTIDYGSVAIMAAAVISDESHLLLETVAQRIADVVLELDRVDAVDVTVRKLRPPVPLQMEHAAVHIHRSN